MSEMKSESPEKRKILFNDEFIYSLVLRYPWVHGLPGNAQVMFELYEYNIDGIVNVAWINFPKKYPEYADEKGWLWVIYKRFCDQDIEATVKFLKELCSWSPSEKSENQ